MFIRLFLVICLWTGFALPLAASASSVVTTERVRAELLAHAPEGVAPGKPLWVGLQITHQPQWHTYWKNPGDSGLPTTMAWTLPASLSAGEIAWPVPRKFPLGNLANYGYEGTVLLPVPLSLAPGFMPLGADLEVKLKANWLVCRKECIPEDGEFTLRLPVRGSTALHGAAFQAAWDAQPRPLTGAGAQSAKVDGQTLSVSVTGLPAAVRGKRLEIYPETTAIIEPAGAWTQGWEGAIWTAKLPLSAQRSDAPTALPVVLADGAQGWRAELAVSGTWPAVTPPAAVSPALEEALRRNADSTRASTVPPSLAAALLGALIGGLILNLMPCVFPVLAVKVVGFARHGQDRRGHRLGGLAYTAGVVCSFLALGGAMLALRAAGEQLGWGFQLQSPAVVAVLAALFTLIGLNLAGVFEFGAMLPSGVASLQARHPVADAFLSGVLAVAIASPCTAPFMGASLGLAVALPAGQALLVFAVLGVGMALPYLAASWVPAVAAWLPRPGAWMETFRRLMAFPMFATVVWLVWVLGQLSGIDGAGALLAMLVAMALAVWTFTLQGRTRVVLATLALVGAALAAWTMGPYVLRAAPVAPVQSASSDRWQAWSEQAVRETLASGRPVFVDFTAAWCVTCQYNKHTTLADEAVLADFAARRVALLRADWTRRDPAITEALAALGRTGVPVYVLYAPGRAPVVLSEVLSAQEVRSLLATL
jgi:thiol:disulfide interchange protein DsbD